MAMTLERPPAPAVRRGAHLPAGWPMYALFVGFPLWWILGISAFVWPLFAIPMAAWLFRQRSVLAPKGFAIWLAFLTWMLASATRLSGVDGVLHFGYRFSLYAAGTIVLLYVYNMSRSSLPASRIITVLAFFWIVVVVGGVLGVVLPNASFTSPFERVLPQRLIQNSFVHDLVHPAFAQIMDVLGYEAPRPKAPFTYATNWGAAFALLTPFVILGWRHAKTRTWKLVTAGSFLVALIPVVVSIDRGLWLGLGVGLLYAAGRFAFAGHGRALRTIIVVIVAILGIVLLSPLRTIVSERFAHPHSNERRLSLYQQSIEITLRSPWLGYGSPQQSSQNPNAPPVGTQGQIWQVLVSHGFPGVTLFLAWFVFRFWRMRHARSDIELWCHTVLLIALVQSPFYDWLGAPVVIIMIAIALGAREPERDAAEARAPAATVRPAPALVG
jgi:polysaccharide biosynthesis protein PslJ